MTHPWQLGWPEEANQRMRELHAEGLSATESAKKLALEFGVTVSRNAVISKWYRGGLTKGSAAAPTLGALKAPAVAKGPPNPVGANASRTYDEPPVAGALTERQKAVDAIAKAPKVMLDPAWGGCRWPLYRTTEAGEPLSCCNDRPNGKAYCAGHQRLAFIKTIPADQRAAEQALGSANRAAGGNPGGLKFSPRAA